MVATKDGTADRSTVCSWECIYGIEFCFFGVGEAWWQYGRLMGAHSPPMTELLRRVSE